MPLPARECGILLNIPRPCWEPYQPGGNPGDEENCAEITIAGWDAVKGLCHCGDGATEMGCYYTIEGSVTYVDCCAQGEGCSHPNGNPNSETLIACCVYQPSEGPEVNTFITFASGVNFAPGGDPQLINFGDTKSFEIEQWFDCDDISHFYSYNIECTGLG